MKLMNKFSLLGILLLAGLVPPMSAAHAQDNVEALRRRLLCLRLGYDLTNPLGQLMLQRCYQGGPLANFQHGNSHPVQLVHPVGPLVRQPSPVIRPPAQRAGDGCQQGYVWREAVPGDHVCVSPWVRQRSRDENRLAASRVNQADHSYGPDTCQGGYVWREVIPSDHVCVTPDIRDEARADNAAAFDRVAR